MKKASTVIAVSDGKEALDWCKERVADVLVTDIQLPGQIDGWDIAEHCREQYPELPWGSTRPAFPPSEARPVPGSMSLQKPYRLRNRTGREAATEGRPPSKSH